MTLALLITGSTGMLGSELTRLVQGQRDIPFARGLTRLQLDLTDPFGVRDVVAEWARVVRSDSPAHRLVVINTAAYTAVDQAEGDEDDAFAVNAAGPAVLATSCLAAGARLIHVSTDYVFPGDAESPYEPGDLTGPRTAYGRTKLAGEQAVREILPEAGHVVRTSWLYGNRGPSFVHTMANLERTKDTISVVDDQIGSPTWTGDLAAALLALAGSDVPAGIHHATNAGATSWHGFAQAVFEELGADPTRVGPTDTASFPRPAPRPAYSVLGEKAWNASGLSPLQPWREALAEAFRTQGDQLRG